MHPPHDWRWIQITCLWLCFVFSINLFPQKAPCQVFHLKKAISHISTVPYFLKFFVVSRRRKLRLSIYRVSIYHIPRFGWQKYRSKTFHPLQSEEPYMSSNYAYKLFFHCVQSNLFVNKLSKLKASNETSRFLLNNKSSWSVSIFNGDIFLLGSAQINDKQVKKSSSKFEEIVTFLSRSGSNLSSTCTPSQVYLEKKLCHFIKSYLESSIITRFSYWVLSFV